MTVNFVWFSHIPRHGVVPRDGFRPANQYELPGSWAGAADALRQTALIQAESEFIASGCGKIRHPVVQLENEGCRRQSAVCK